MLDLLKKPYFQKLLLVLAGVVIAAALHWGLGIFAALVGARYLVNLWEKPLAKLIDWLRREEAVDMPLNFETRSDELADLCYAIAVKLGRLQDRERSLRQEYRQTLSILNELSEGVVVVDAEKRVTFINEPARRLLAITIDAPQGRQLLEVIRLVQVSELVDRLLAGETIASIDVKIEGESILTLNVTGAVFQAVQRQALLVVHNVTQLRQTEQVRKDFVSNVSHELKTPLMAISAAVETLLSGAINDSAHNVRFLNTIDRYAQRLQFLIKDILTLSKIENALPAEEFQSLKLPDVINQAIDDVRGLADRGRITLVQQVSESGAEGVLKVLGRPSELRQVFINLLENAVNYTPEGGRVQVSLVRDGSYAMVNVEDNGVGIPPEQLPRIFERFYRVDPARSREKGGTGLGLSIVKHSVLAHQGTVDVNSQEGKGTVFTVRLPLQT